jgi:hypothetical protein
MYSLTTLNVNKEDIEIVNQIKLNEQFTTKESIKENFLIYNYLHV